LFTTHIHLQAAAYVQPFSCTIAAEISTAAATKARAFSLHELLRCKSFCIAKAAAIVLDKFVQHQ
jgi:hypothetical protein